MELTNIKPTRLDKNFNELGELGFPFDDNDESNLMLQPNDQMFAPLGAYTSTKINEFRRRDSRKTKIISLNGITSLDGDAWGSDDYRVEGIYNHMDNEGGARLMEQNRCFVYSYMNKYRAGAFQTDNNFAYIVGGNHRMILSIRLSESLLPMTFKLQYSDATMEDPQGYGHSFGFTNWVDTAMPSFTIPSGSTGAFVIDSGDLITPSNSNFRHYRLLPSTLLDIGTYLSMYIETTSGALIYRGIMDSRLHYTTFSKTLPDGWIKSGIGYLSQRMDVGRATNHTQDYSIADYQMQYGMYNDLSSLNKQKINQPNIVDTGTFALQQDGSRDMRVPFSRVYLPGVGFRDYDAEFVMNPGQTVLGPVVGGKRCPYHSPDYTLVGEKGLTTVRSFYADAKKITLFLMPAGVGIDSASWELYRVDDLNHIPFEGIYQQFQRPGNPIEGAAVSEFTSKCTLVDAGNFGAQFVFGRYTVNIEPTQKTYSGKDLYIIVYRYDSTPGTCYYGPNMGVGSIIVFTSTPMPPIYDVVSDEHAIEGAYDPSRLMPITELHYTSLKFFDERIYRDSFSTTSYETCQIGRKKIIEVENGNTVTIPIDIYKMGTVGINQYQTVLFKNPTLNKGEFVAMRMTKHGGYKDGSSWSMLNCSPFEPSGASKSHAIGSATAGRLGSYLQEDKYQFHAGNSLNWVGTSNTQIYGLPAYSYDGVPIYATYLFVWGYSTVGIGDSVTIEIYSSQNLVTSNYLTPLVFDSWMSNFYIRTYTPSADEILKLSNKGISGGMVVTSDLSDIMGKYDKEKKILECRTWGRMLQYMASVTIYYIASKPSYIGGTADYFLYVTDWILPSDPWYQYMGKFIKVEGITGNWHVMNGSDWDFPNLKHEFNLKEYVYDRTEDKLVEFDQEVSRINVEAGKTYYFINTIRGRSPGASPWKIEKVTEESP